jgi:hypothetical protein
MREGFADGEGEYITTTTHRGVRVTRDEPWSEATGGIAGTSVLVVCEVPPALFDSYDRRRQGLWRGANTRVRAQRSSEMDRGESGMHRGLHAPSNHGISDTSVPLNHAESD